MASQTKARVIPLDELGDAVKRHESWAYIQIVNKGGRLGYVWEGRADATVAISEEFLKDDPGLLARLPWRLEEVNRDIEANCVIYRRAGLN